MENEVVGFSSLFAFDGWPKSSCKTHDEDAQGDGSSDDGIDDDEEEGKDDRGDNASEKVDSVLIIAKKSNITVADTARS